MRNIAFGLAAIGVIFCSTAAVAADPALVCQSGKLKTAGKYGACRLSAESKAVKTQSSPDYGKCNDKFSPKWTGAETKAGPGVCPTEGDAAGVSQRVTWHTDAIATLLSGGVPVDPYSPATGQTATFGPGDDGDVEAGATMAFADNSDGTITDLNTGLMWEKKVQGTGGYNVCIDETGTCANPHNADNVYDWSDGPCCSETDYDGTIVTIFLEQLNNRCGDDTTVSCTVDSDCSVPGGPCGFAGHRDWRLPNMKELQGIIDWGTYSPALNVAFHGGSCGLACTDITDPACSCDASSIYWSATTFAGLTTYAWVVNTYYGYVSNDDKTYVWSVRAVRGGS